MKKTEKEIAMNTSSGAEKVETIEKEVKTQPSGVKKAQPTAKTAKVQQEDAAAKARVKAAQEKEKAEKASKEAQKAAAQRRKEERAARIAKIKAEREEKRRQRAHAIAEKHQERAKKKKERAKLRAERRKGERNKKERPNGRKSGNGGWIAAVSVLGATTLALTAALTAGAVEMKRSTESTMTAYRGTMYELTGLMEHVDNDLERVRISASGAQQSRILTDLLVQARMAELDLEKLPLAAENERGLTAFLNRTAWECERMLAKLRRGEELSNEDFNTLERLYAANHSVRVELDKTLATMTDESLQQFIKKGTGGIADAMQRIEKGTLEENRSEMERGVEKVKDKAEDAKDKMKKMKDKLQDKVEEKMQEMTEKTAATSENVGKDLPHIESAHAEQLCKKYFSEYDISQYQCVGETVTKGYSAYNVEGYDSKGTLLFAEISQKDGALLRFDYYEDCDADTFDLQNAERIAEEFLDKLGYDDMEVVRYRENGTMTDFTFVYEEDDVAYYPDEVHVKVCRSRGVVTALDATKYIQNHKQRVAPKVEISMDEARARLHEKLSVEASRLAVVKTKRGERAAYEFLCSYGDENYFVYLDGVTGEEISIINAKGIQ